MRLMEIKIGEIQREDQRQKRQFESGKRCTQRERKQIVLECQKLLDQEQQLHMVSEQKTNFLEEKEAENMECIEHKHSWWQFWK